MEVVSLQLNENMSDIIATEGKWKWYYCSLREIKGNGSGIIAA